MINWQGGSLLQKFRLKTANGKVHELLIEAASDVEVAVAISVHCSAPFEPHCVLASNSIEIHTSALPLLRQEEEKALY